MKISTGEDIELIDDIEGDIFELIWRECVLMEKKNGKDGLDNTGNVINGGVASNPASNSHPKIKENKRK